MALVLRAEGTLLQLDHHQSLQLSVVEQEVDVEVLSVNLDALLRFVVKICGQTGLELC